MKSILLAIFAVAALAVSAQAQQYSVNTLSTTNAISANTTITPGSVIAATKHLNVALQPSFALANSGTANVTFSFARSVDGTTFESTPSVSLVVAANGTNTVTGFTNVSMGAGGYLKLTSVANANSTNVTGLNVLYGIKPGEK
jgi:hypothetical protein